MKFANPKLIVVVILQMNSSLVVVADPVVADAAEIGPMCEGVVGAVPGLDVPEESDAPAEHAAEPGTRDAKDSGYSCIVVVEFLLLLSSCELS